MTIPPLLTSHTLDIQDQFLAHLEADAGLAAFQPTGSAPTTPVLIFEGTAPRGQKAPYIVGLDGTERPKPSYGGGGTEGSDSYRIVAYGPGKRQVKQIYALFVASCVSFSINPTGIKTRLLSFRPSLIQTFADPSDANGITMLGVVRVDWRAYASQ